MIAIALNLLLALLLVATLMFGWVLNRRLKALKDSHAGFAEAVNHLDRAAQRAEQGLAELRAATDSAVDLLTSRMLKARELADNLERLTARGAAVLERHTQERGALPPTPRAIADRIAAERAQFHPGQAGAAAPRPAPGLAARYPVTTEDEALAAAESLILKLSQSEVLTSDEPPRRAAVTAPRARLDPAADLRMAPRPELRAPEPRAEARVHPRSRAQIDDDLFEPPARGRFRAFDGGLA